MRRRRRRRRRNPATAAAALDGLGQRLADGAEEMLMAAAGAVLSNVLGIPVQSKPQQVPERVETRRRTREAKPAGRVIDLKRGPDGVYR